jgi:topoisomerase-4 subunit A
LPAHGIASARGQGEPLTGRIKSTVGRFESLIMGNPEDKIVLASDLGYGFIAKLDDLISKNKSGKAVLNVPENGHALSITPITDVEHDYIVAVTNIGNLLMFPLAELPELAKGKGNKIINIPTEKYKTREEFVVDVVVLHTNETLKLFSGQRCLTLKLSDLQHYLGKRAQRGNKLPRGYQRIERVEVGREI